MERDQLNRPSWAISDDPDDPDEVYLRGQAGQAGSGLQSGQSEAWFGGELETPRGLQAEVRRTIDEMARERLRRYGAR